MQRTLPDTSHNKESGFTLVELLIAIILSGVVVTIFIAALLTMVSTAVLQKTQLELSQRNQIALDVIERDIRLALAFETTLPYATFDDAYGPDGTDEGWTGSWSYKGSDSDHRVLVLAERATRTHPLAASRDPVYVRGSLDSVYAAQDLNLNCTIYNATTSPTGALTYNPKLPYYLVYFVRDGNLYRRTVTDTTTTLCAGQQQYQKQSCPSVDSSPATTCAANDEVIAYNVAEFTVDYFSLDDSATPTDISAYTSTSPTIFNDISNVVVTLRLQKTVSGKDRSSTLSVRVSRVNQ